MIAILTHGGWGDMLHGFKCAHWVKKSRQDVIVFCSSDEAKFEALNHLFGGKFYISRIDERWCQNELPARKPEVLKEIPELNEISQVYTAWPDLLERGPLSFPYQRFGVSLPTLYQTRLLASSWTPKDRVFVGVCSSTEGYHYEAQWDLVKNLAESNPNHEIYWSIVSSWAGKQIPVDSRVYDPLSRSTLPQNVTVSIDIDFRLALNALKTSCYCLCADNGISHIAYAYGIPRLLLDSRFGYGPNELPWVARWKEVGLNESIRIETDPESVAKVVTTNLWIPQTQLIPRSTVLHNLHATWSQELLFKL